MVHIFEEIEKKMTKDIIVDNNGQLGIGPPPGVEIVTVKACSPVDDAYLAGRMAGVGEGFGLALALFVVAMVAVGVVQCWNNE